MIEIRIPAWLSASDEADTVADLVARIERKRAARESQVDLAGRAAKLATEYDLPVPESIEWSNRQNTRWGSCTPGHGTIRISTLLANVPVWVLDFVILHELTHLVEANHSPRFHALLNRYPKSAQAEGFLAAMSGGHADDQWLAG